MATTPADDLDVARVRAAHEAFVATGRVVAGAVRAAVVDSWRRSVRGGVDPDRFAAPVETPLAEVAAIRRAHPLAAGIPLARHLLLEPDAGWVAALTDAAGRLLWVEGDRTVRRAIETVGFVEGATWREDTAGTNAPGVALATGREVRVQGAEHWARSVHPFSCAAAPVRDSSGRVLGVLDVTGGPVAGTPLALSLVRATATAMQVVLSPAATAAEPALRVLGTPGGLLTLPGESGGGTVRLSRRHGEILLLLVEHPAGLSADELAVLLSGDDLSDVTVRAEISRLRRVVGPLLPESRPYRLTRAVRTDVQDVRDALSVGELASALAAYPGPVLPRSCAPGVERIRDDLAADLRAAVLATRDPAVLSQWVAREENAEDWPAWQALAAASAAGSPTRLRAELAMAAITAHFV